MYYVRALDRVGRLGLAGTAVSDAGLSRLSGLTCRVLQLGRTTISDTGLANLRTLRGLDTLELNDAPLITDAGLEYLKPHTALRRLAFNGTQITGAGLRFLSGLNNLRSLSLRSTRATDQSLVHLRGIQGLESLELTGNAITGAAFELLEDELRTVRFLYLNQTHLNDRGLAWIARMPDLEVLELADTQVTDAGLIHLRHLRALRELVLDNTPIDGRGLVHLSQLTSLTSLRLNGTQVGDEGLAHLRPLAKLQTLELDSTPITDAGLEQLSELRGLQRLLLKHTSHVSDDAVFRLRQELRDTQIEHDLMPFSQYLSLAQRPAAEKLQNHNVELDYCEAADGPILTVSPRSLQDYGDSPGELGALLRDLTDQLGFSASDLRYARQPLDGTALIDSLRSLPNLRALYLPHGKRAEIPYGRISELTGLHTLDLNASDIRDEDLAQIAKLPNLRQLNLDQCHHVTDVGVAELRRCPQLSRLYISGTQVSHALRQVLDSKSTVLVRLVDAREKSTQWTVPRDARFELFLKRRPQAKEPFTDFRHKSVHWDHRMVRIRYFRGTGSGVILPRGQVHRCAVESFLMVTPETRITFDTPPGSQVVIQQDDKPIISIDVVAD